VSTQGDIAIAANSIESCLDVSPACGNVRDGVGSGLNNNDRTMTWIDVDGDPSTFDSSSSDLSLPAGASVLFAGLYYGGRLTAGSGGSPPPNAAARNTVLFKAPGDTSYRTLSASQIDDASTQYQSFVNVTGLVAAAGAGTYWTANVQLGTGLSDSSSGGWALVVAYGDPAAPSRNLAVFDGLVNVSSSGSATIPLSGFQTPLAGPVSSRVGIVAYEGDLGTTGDGAQILGAAGFSALSNAVNPANNVFNSTISNAGTLITSRTPSYRNNLGYDADLFQTTNVLGNGQTSTQVRLSTNGDAYQPGVVTLTTDLFAPKISATKSVDRTNANLGDTLTYTVAVQNTGQDAATDTTFSDPIPAGAVFLPDSIRVNGVPVSDAAGDDLGEFAGGRVVARVGTGATATAGGTLAPGGASATVSFQVTVATSGLAVGATIDNAADLSFRAATTGVASTVTTAPASTRVLVPDLAIGKSHTPALAPGAPSTYTITVANLGDGPSVGPVTVTDPFPAGLALNGAITAPGWACGTIGATVSCTRTDPLAAGAAYPAITVPVLVDPSAQPAQLENTAEVAAPSDGNPDNDVFTDTAPVSQPAIDLHVEKTVTSTPGNGVDYFPGELVSYRIEVSNLGIATAHHVQLSDVLDPDMVLQSITPSQGSCIGTSCDLGGITTTQAPVTIDITVQLAADGSLYPFDGRRLANTATASAPLGSELNPDDNSATATIPTQPWSDLAITKSFTPAEPVAGGPVTYTLDVRNKGPGTVDAFVGDFVPPALQNPNPTVSIAGGTGDCGYDPTGASTGGLPTALCEIPQFAPGEERIVTVQGTLAADSAGTLVDNIAFTQGSLEFVNIEDNVAEVSFTPGTVDVGITKTVVGASTVGVGDVATFRLVASNSGTLAAHNVVATDNLPAGLAPVDLPAGCVPAGQVVSCALGTLAPGASQAFDLRASVDASAAASTVTNGASIRSDETDLDPGNDTSTAQLTIKPLPIDVAVTVEPPDGLATVGVPGRWTLTIVNHGPATATNVALATAVHGNADVLGASPPAVCVTSPAVKCDLGTLAPGDTRTVTVDLRPTAAGKLDLTGTVDAAETDSIPASNTDHAAITTGVATVDLTATANPSTLPSGAPTMVTIETVTRSRRPVRNASICVRIPEGLATVRPTGATSRRGRLCWRIAFLAHGHRRVFHLRVSAPCLSRAYTTTLNLTAAGRSVHTRRARLALHILRCAARRPPIVTG
jgi:uncharacterized repeat protein (TIGR01451 family)